MFYGEELDINIAASLYNINIETYEEIFDNNNNIMGFYHINYYNINNLESRHLLLVHIFFFFNIYFT